MTTTYVARWVLPIAAPPIDRGWVRVRGARIEAVGAGEPPPGAEVVDVGDAVLLPGLVNAHTHIELSWMKDRVAPSDSMPRWAAALMALRRTHAAEPAAPIVDALREARAAGTSVLGDVTNTLGAYEPLARSGMAAAVFRELLGFSAADPRGLAASARDELTRLRTVDRLRTFVVPHAPYSVSAELVRAIADVCASGPLSVHLAESAEEIRFLRDGTGPWRELLGALGAWSERWTPPGCGAIDYMARLGLLSPRLLAVHAVHASDDELRRLAGAGATVVTCPRSNRWTGAGVPPIERFYASGVRVAFGTDSLASVEDLNVFAELAAARAVAPAVPARRLLESATRAGAEALGFGADFGTIAPGRAADLLAVRVPGHVVDVEEYLVSGVDPAQVRWATPPPTPS